MPASSRAPETLSPFAIAAVAAVARGGGADRGEVSTLASGECLAARPTAGCAARRGWPRARPRSRGRRPRAAGSGRSSGSRRGLDSTSRSRAWSRSPNASACSAEERARRVSGRRGGATRRSAARCGWPARGADEADGAGLAMLGDLHARAEIAPERGGSFARGGRRCGGDEQAGQGEECDQDPLHRGDPLRRSRTATTPRWTNRRLAGPSARPRTAPRPRRRCGRRRRAPAPAGRRPSARRPPARR